LNELAVLAEQHLDAHANRNVYRLSINMKPMDRLQLTDDRKIDRRMKEEIIKGMKEEMIGEMMLGMIEEMTGNVLFVEEKNILLEIVFIQIRLVE